MAVPRFRILRFDDGLHALPRNQLVHAAQDDLFVCAPPLLIQLANSEGQLVIHQ